MKVPEQQTDPTPAETEVTAVEQANQATTTPDTQRRLTVEDLRNVGVATSRATKTLLAQSVDVRGLEFTD